MRSVKVNFFIHENQVKYFRMYQEEFSITNVKYRQQSAQSIRISIVVSSASILMF